MSALVLPLWTRLRALFAAESKTWTCDQCGAINSNSVSTCYRCGA